MQLILWCQHSLENNLMCHPVFGWGKIARAEIELGGQDTLMNHTTKGVGGGVWAKSSHLHMAICNEPMRQTPSISRPRQLQLRSWYPTLRIFRGASFGPKATCIAWKQWLVRLCVRCTTWPVFGPLSWLWNWSLPGLDEREREHPLLQHTQYGL